MASICWPYTAPLPVACSRSQLRSAEGVLREEQAPSQLRPDPNSENGGQSRATKVPLLSALFGPSHGVHLRSLI